MIIATAWKWIVSAEKLEYTKENETKFQTGKVNLLKAQWLSHSTAAKRKGTQGCYRKRVYKDEPGMGYQRCNPDTGEVRGKKAWSACHLKQLSKYEARPRVSIPAGRVAHAYGYRETRE